MADADEIKTDDAPEIVKTEDVVLAPEPELTEGEEDAGDELSDAGKKELAPEDGIQDLKRRLEAEQAARHEAEKRAYEAYMRAQQSHAEAQDSNYQMVLSALSTVEQRAAAFRSAYVEAMQAGDYDKAAQIQEALIVNANHHAELQKGRKAMEEALQRQPAQPVASPQDPIEMWAAQVTPRSANWLRNNKAALSSPAMQKRVVLAHQLSQDEGFEPDSDAYFDFVEQQIGLKKQPAPRQARDEPDADSPLSAAAAPAAPRRSAPPPAAPVSRGTPRANAVRLSADEREAARISGISEEEYARNKERERTRASGR